MHRIPRRPAASCPPRAYPRAAAVTAPVIAPWQGAYIDLSPDGSWTWHSCAVCGQRLDDHERSDGHHRECEPSERTVARRLRADRRRYRADLHRARHPDENKRPPTVQQSRFILGLSRELGRAAPVVLTRRNARHVIDRLLADKRELELRQEGAL